MPDSLTPLPEPDICRFGCGSPPIDAILPMAANSAPAHEAEAGATARSDRRPPEILLRSDHAWRRKCLGETAHIPSGYTYLGQLMGHDIGSSVALSSVPHAVRGPVIGAVSVLGPKRYNLIDNPLTLETVYGPGPLMLSHVYDPATMLFRLTPGARLARLYRANNAALAGTDSRPIRALYDERNRDTLMLHELAVAWMQFHNLCARQLLDRRIAPFAAYSLTRSHAVHVWHGMIRADILPRFVHPEIASVPDTDLAAEWRLDEATLLHGLFRAFHAMPLAAYNLGRQGMHNLADLLKSGFDISEAESDWNIDWPLFFGLKPGGPMTGLSASVAPELRAPVSAAAVIALDTSAAAQASPLRLGNASIEAACARLPAPWPERLTPDALSTEFGTHYPDSPVRLSAETIEWGPLFQAIMVEAQLYGEKGGLGPLGSALLRGSIIGSIERVVLAPEHDATCDLPTPRTMTELIELVREV